MIFDVVIADEDNDGNTVPVLNEKQAKRINDLLSERDIDEAKFWKWAGCQTAEQMPLEKLANAVDMLLAKPLKGESDD